MVRIRIINPEEFQEVQEVQQVQEEKDIYYATWHSRTKTYDWDMNMIDDDIKNCTIGHNIDSIEFDNIYLSSKQSVQDFIDLLENAKKSIRI